MFYRIKDNRLYDFADYQYAEDCLETNIITMQEYDEDKQKVIIQNGVLKLNPNYDEILKQREKEQTILSLKEQLNEIDRKKIRSTSAIALNIATPADYAKLQELEQQAATIRQQLQALGGI